MAHPHRPPSLAGIAAAAVPLALARIHWATAVGELRVLDRPTDLEVARRWADLLVGAGFVPGDDPARPTTYRRARTLPDTVGPYMRVLVCGLNPSLVAADAGYGYAGPTNRFWPAAMAAGLVSRRGDPLHALLADDVGMTDLVKRATPSAGALRADEYRAGLARVGRLVEWLRPGVVLFVGLAGWRAAVDRAAVAGWQPSGVAGLRGPNTVTGLRGPNAVTGVPAYVMPSTSGLNAHASRAALVEHMEAALGRAAGSDPFA